MTLKETLLSNDLTIRSTLSVIVPCHNEAEIVADNVNMILDALQKFTTTFELIVCEDGSTDGTDKIVQGIAKVNPLVKHFHSDARLGKGGAIVNGIKVASYDTILFMDMDLSTDLEHVPQFYQFITDGYDLVVGSRKNSQRTFRRKLASSVYNWLVRVLFDTKINDHQCGFKAMKKSSLMEIVSQIQNSGFLFDTELIVRSRKKNLRILETPVRWKESERASKVSLFRDACKMSKNLLAMKKAIK